MKEVIEMKSQGQISLAIAAALIFVFLVFSSDQYLVLGLALAVLAGAMVVRVVASGELSMSNLRKPHTEQAVTAVGPNALEVADHSFHRVYPR